MDFAFTEEQDAIRELAEQILAAGATHERILELERSGEWFDAALWSELARANLTSVAVSEAHGGSGFGIVELCLVLEAQGRHVAPVPLHATALSAMTIEQFGDDAQKRQWLGAVANEEAVLTAALTELGGSVPARPRATAQRDGDGWRLDGEKECVPAAHMATAVLVPARTDDGVGVFLVDPQSSGVTLERQITTSREPQARVVLSGARARSVLGDPAGGEAIVEWLVARAQLGLAAIQVGVAEAAIRQTATYVSERKQFGRPIGTFQGVSLRAADAYIDVEAMRATVQQAAWRVEQGLPAATEIGAAKWWAAVGGQRVVHTAQHLHGGIGSDIEYPIHRYFLWSKQNELALGGAAQTQAQIGALLVADAPAQEGP